MINLCVALCVKFCDIRDGVKLCDYFDIDEISILLTSLCTDYLKTLHTFVS